MEGVAQALVGNLGQLVGTELQQLRGVGREVAQLRDELATMNSVLRMQSEADESAVDHFVREWMKQVRELAYDAEDCVDLYVFRIRCLLSDAFLVRFRRVVATLTLRHRLAGDVRDLRARAVIISERHARYGVSREALRRNPLLAPVSTGSAASARALRPAAADRPDQFVGMTDQASALTERVRAGSKNNGELAVLSIVGFAGLGKTTLAMEVCRRLETEFQRQAQVSVSQAFDGRSDVGGLLKRVLQQIVKPKAGNEKGIKEENSAGDIDKMDVDTLAKTLKDLLKDKRYGRNYTCFGNILLLRCLRIITPSLAFFIYVLLFILFKIFVEYVKLFKLNFKVKQITIKYLLFLNFSNTSKSQ
jgi:disease resistance protein RPM1